MEPTPPPPQQRSAFPDLLRVTACLMVILVHAAEPYYIGARGAVLKSDTFWPNVYGSLTHACIPLFVILSGYLLLPLRTSTPVFLRRRFTRIVLPFVVWAIVYAILPWAKGDYDALEAGRTALLMLVNYNYHTFHLWFLYMLVGLYLFMPVLSAWLQVAAPREKYGFLALWAFTLALPYVRMKFPALLGEAPWNNISTVYYFSGFTGYLVLGNVLREHLSLSRGGRVVIGIALVAAGYAISFQRFGRHIASSNDIGFVELPWGFTTINMALTALGVFLLLGSVRLGDGLWRRAISDVAILSFGIYLVHYAILNALVERFLGTLPQAQIGIPVFAASTFMLSYAVTKLLSLLPVRRYFLG